MARPTIQDIRQIGQISSKCRWNLDFIKQPTAGIGFALSKDLNLRCESVDIPTSEVKTIPVKIRQYEISRPSVVKQSGTINLKFYETNNGIIHDFFGAWQDACMNMETGLSNDKNLIDAIIAISLLDNKDDVVRVFTLYGCILEDYKKENLANDDKPLMANIVIAYDYYKEQKNDILGNLVEVGKTAMDLFDVKLPEKIGFLRDLK